MSSAFNLDFEVSGIHGYVMMDGVMPTLTEITCTFWMKSSDTTNYGTPVSYAVEGSDNAFLLIDYNGSVNALSQEDMNPHTLCTSDSVCSSCYALIHTYQILSVFSLSP